MTSPKRAFRPSGALRRGTGSLTAGRAAQFGFELATSFSTVLHNAAGSSGSSARRRSFWLKTGWKLLSYVKLQKMA
jgi:hypothetical protein